ncbi:MAG: redoxin domain-containing protein [Candidatus Shikimatogenerans bostrichidophilus]|nr:MAG: redoxin domain-containing protein [Candidatus Shikimatogenerans bostrichidophilus]
MINLINKITPNFLYDGIKNNKIIKKINFKKYINNKYIILFFTTYRFIQDLFEFQLLYKDFYIRNVEVICILTDKIQFKLNNKIKFLLFYDTNKIISYKYNLLTKINKELNKTIFFIDNNKFIRHISIHNKNINYNINEILRIIDKWQYYNKYGNIYFKKK